MPTGIPYDSVRQETALGVAPSAPDEWGGLAVGGLEHGGRKRLRQVRIIEADAEIVARVVAARALAPSGAQLRVPGEHAEVRRALVVAIVVRHKACSDADGQRADGPSPAAILGGREGADDGHGCASFR